VLDFAVGQILRDDTALGALPAVLARLVSISGVRAALAFQPSAAQPATVLAMHPRGAVDPALLAKIGALTLTQRDPGATTPVQVTVESDGVTTHALLAYSAPVGGQCLCALALIGDVASWDEDIRATAHAVAAMVATQIRHANDLAKLAERQALTRALIAGSPEAILAIDARCRLVEFNPAAEELSGYRRDDVLGREMSELLIPDKVRPWFNEHFRACLTAGDTGRFTGPVRVALLRADGSERIVELTTVHVRVSGEPVFCSFLRDLTEVERSYAALADQTERLNCLIAAAIPSIVITDENSRITHVSHSFGLMFGIEEPEQLVGTSAASMVRRLHPQFEDPEAFARRSAEVFSDRQPVSRERMKAADGRTIENDYWPVLVDGRFRGDLWLAEDMSAHAALDDQRQQALEAELAGRQLAEQAQQLAEQAQQQLEEQNERLRKLDEARNQFLAIVSHELRTPLTSIVSFSELIRGEADGLTPEGVSFLDIIERNADRLHRLVGDLLMLDRLEAGALPLDLAPVSVADLTAEAVRSASPAAAKQDVTIDVSAGPGPLVPGDQRRLMQVLDNLIANAVKFSNRNSHVHVSAAFAGGSWRIDVTDSGIGIPPDEAGQLFTRFVRASNARTAGLPGTGLGLSIVKVLTEMHGGHVEVASTLGQGSTFSVYLPAPTELSDVEGAGE